MYWKYVYIIQTLILTIVVVDAQDCMSNLCLNGATCTDGDPYECTCVAGYSGTNCETDIDDCSPNPCQNGGTCTDGVNSYTCGCMDGYTGLECETDINECSSSPCENGGTCTDSVDSYMCGCVDGYTGLECQTDIDDCSPNPCQNGGTCSDSVNSYTCGCLDGYTGLECETDINECLSLPCQNGASCVDGVNMYTCDCLDGFNGAECQTNIDECSSNPCQNGGTCTDGVNSYTCGCMDGYTGLECQTDVDECVDTPCSNGGSCSNTLGSFSCECVPGYAGSICDSEIDECSSNPCQNGATCVDAVNMYTCTCIAGYEGQNCDTDMNECLSSPCMNGAACTDEVNGFTCQCAAGYTGTTCSVDIDECASDPCGNNGVCTDVVNGFTCQCGPGYTDITCRESVIGDTCADRTDVCSGLNHATCTDGTCQCLPGYSVTASGVCDIISSQFAVQCVITAQCTTIDSACRLDSDDVTRCMCPVSGKSFYVAAADTCVSVATVTFGGVCIADIQCMTSNSTCYDIGGTGSTVCACPSVIYTYHDSAVDECLSDCGGLSAPTNGLVQLPEHTVAGQTATYTCHVGYALSGNDVRICTSAGGWSGDTPLCLVGCATPDPPTNGYVNVTSRLVGGVASYNCGEGYVLVGNTHRACQADSQWAGNTPECKRECLILTAIPHGAVDDSAGTWEGSVATYVCMDSYTLKGAASRMCLASGRWSGVEPSCTDATFPTQLNLILGSLLLVAALVLLFIGGLLAYNRCIKPRYKKEASEAESAVEFAELSGGASQEGMVPPSDTRRQWKVKNAQIVPEDEDGDTAHPPPSMKQRALPFDRSRFRFMNAVREPMKETFTNPSKIVDPTLGNGELLRKILKSEAGTTSDDVDKKSLSESDGVPNMTDLTQLNSTAQPVIDGPRGRSKSPHPIANDNHLDRFKSQERQLNNFKGALKAYKS